MNNESLHQFLVLYTWFPLAALLFFMLLIARFYKIFSGHRTYFWYYGVVIVLFGIVAVRYASVGAVLGDTVTDIVSIIAGGLLTFLCAVLYHWMIRKNHQP
ncbi:MAG: hypothetical protein Q9P01_09085 [Anaerolineae bacterium]|nr:hypothetical protein [Anaerolineae bacterium]MDQ7034971.1 hypothetical protein [Anaerolineae bacterium]